MQKRQKQKRKGKERGKSCIGLATSKISDERHMENSKEGESYRIVLVLVYCDLEKKEIIYESYLEKTIFGC